MNESKTTLDAKYFFSIDPAKPFTLWQKFKLFWCRGRTSRDGTTYVVTKFLDGKVYIVEMGEFQ